MKMFEATFKKEKESILINEKELDDHVLEELLRKYHKLFSVKKINFCENSLEDMSKIFELFPNLEIAMLSIFIFI